MLIYSKDKREYKAYIYIVVNRLYSNRLYIDLSKYYFKIKRVKYLGLIIIIEGLEIDSKKVQAILD
jgi:hypothetical protein